MPQKPKGARLYCHPKTKIFIIRDTGRGDRSTGTRNRDEAETALATYITDRDRPLGGPANPAEIHISEILNLYGTEHAPTVKDPMRIGYALDPLLRWWGDRKVSSITHETCRAYGRDRKKVTKRDASTGEPIEWAPCSRGTVRKELGVLAAALNYAHGEGRLLNPPKVHLPSKPAPKDRWLTREEAARLLLCAYRNPSTKHLAKFILVALYTGTRKSRILNLRYVQHLDGGWIDTDRGQLFRRAPGEEETKKRAPHVRIAPRLLGHLRRWEASGDGYVVAFRGQKVASIKNAWARASKAAGLQDVTPHTLRHTAITWACQSGRAELWELAGYFGVSLEVMTTTYAHHHPDHQQNAVAAIGGKL